MAHSEEGEFTTGGINTLDSGFMCMNFTESVRRYRKIGFDISDAPYWKLCQTGQESI